jgi:choline dehydrogenase-like flavoprotein
MNPEKDISADMKCEYLVIGSGAGGSVVARELARAGKDVLVAEEGGHFKTSEFNDTTANQLRKLYRSGGVTPIIGKPIVGFAEGACVGGSTVINAGYFSRTPQRILDQWSRNLDLRSYGMEDLIPHFENIERDLSVSIKKDDGSNKDSVAMEEGCRKLGWRIEPAPRVIKECSNQNRCPTGCPTEAKRSMLVSYLPQAFAAGAKIIPNLRITKIIRERNRIRCVKARSKESGEEITIHPDFVFLSGGAVQTPFLLRKSGLSKRAGKRLEFHMNFKVVAKFDHVVNAEKSTVSLNFVREFEDEGALISPANFRLPFVLSTLAHHDNSMLKQVVAESNRYGLFVTQIQSKSVARVHAPFAAPFMTYKFHQDDLHSLRINMIRTAKLLFASGCEEVLFPVQGMRAVTTVEEVELAANKLKPKDIELVTVHAMSSCPMGRRENGAVVDENGKVYGYDNLFICDASVLPTNIGESPQATIMAFSHEIVNRHITASRQ